MVLMVTMFCFFDSGMKWRRCGDPPHVVQPFEKVYSSLRHQRSTKKLIQCQVDRFLTLLSKLIENTFLET